MTAVASPTIPGCDVGHWTDAGGPHRLHGRAVPAERDRRRRARCAAARRPPASSRCSSRAAPCERIDAVVLTRRLRLRARGGRRRDARGARRGARGFPTGAGGCRSWSAMSRVRPGASATPRCGPALGGRAACAAAAPVSDSVGRARDRLHGRQVARPRHGGRPAGSAERRCRRRRHRRGARRGERRRRRRRPWPVDEPWPSRGRSEPRRDDEPGRPRRCSGSPDGGDARPADPVAHRPTRRSVSSPPTRPLDKVGLPPRRAGRPRRPGPAVTPAAHRRSTATPSSPLPSPHGPTTCRVDRRPRC